MPGLFRIALLILFLFTTCLTSGKAEGRYRVSILTCGVGDDLYSVFGHTAIRILDKVNNTDIVYNFGTFNADSPNFMSEFLSGKLLYFLSREDFSTFIYNYKWENRDVIEQELFLAPEQTDAIIRQLELADTDSSRYYAYDFFKNNCTTKVRDLFWCYYRSTGDRDSLFYGCTFRELLRSHLIAKEKRWLNLGIDIILGCEIDKPISGNASLFLPGLLSKELGNERTVGKETVLSQRVSQPNDVALMPGYLFYGLLFIYLIMTFMRFDRKQLVNRTISVSLMLVTGIVGLVIFYNWFFINRDIFTNNYNLVWTLPSNLLLACAAIRNKGELKWLYKIHLVLVSIFIVSIPWLPQSINISIIPLLILLILTYFQNSVSSHTRN